MSRYRKVDPRIWNDAKFRELSDNAKLVFFMLLTHPGMTALGAMRATLPGLAAELGWDSEAFLEAFREISEKGMAEHDPKACLVALPRFLRYNPPESPNVVKAWEAALDLLPECDLKSAVISWAKQHLRSMSPSFRKALPEGFREAFAKTCPNQEQEQDQEQDLSHTPGAGAREGESGEVEEPPASKTLARPVGSPAPSSSAGDVPSDPEVRKILEKLGDYDVLKPVATARLAERIGGRQMARGTPIDVILEAIDQAARSVESQDAVGAVWDAPKIADLVMRYCEKAAIDWTNRPRDDRQRTRGERQAGLPPVQPQARPGQYDWREEAEKARAEKLRELEKEAAEMPAAVGGGG